MKCITLIIFTALLLSCNTSIKDCNCNKIEIYGYPSSGIYTPIRITQEDMLEMEPYILKNSETISQIKAELNKLTPLSYNGNNIDNRFLIKLYCLNEKEIIIQSNNYITHVNNSFYKPSSSFINLIKKTIANKK